MPGLNPVVMLCGEQCKCMLYSVQMFARPVSSVLPNLCHTSCSVQFGEAYPLAIPSATLGRTSLTWDHQPRCCISRPISEPYSCLRNSMEAVMLYTVPYRCNAAAPLGYNAAALCTC